MSRHYVQPQWVFDSLNHRVLMPAELYAPGSTPPPHLSPFVDNEAEGYTPEFAHTIKQLQVRARAGVAGRGMLRVCLRLGAGCTRSAWLHHPPTPAATHPRAHPSQAAAAAARRAAAGQQQERTFLHGDEAEEGGAAGAGGADGAARAGAGGAGGADAAAVERSYQAELARELREAAGQPASGSGDDGSADGSEDEDERKRLQAAGSRKRPAAAAHDEADALADIMMTRKTRKLYGRINRAIQGKAERVAALEARKAAVSAKQQQQQKGADAVQKRQPAGKLPRRKAAAGGK
jgi:pescadillo protein